METIYIQHPIAESIATEMESCVLALGFFDGVHIGHRGILETAKKMAKQKQCTFGVMTFYPHPKDILFPDREPMTYLTPLPVKEERFEKLGVEKLFIVEFNPDFARLSPEDFVEQYITGLRCKHVVAGFDYHYGSKGLGNMETLSNHRLGKFDVTTVHKIEHASEKISSTAIRELLAGGHVKVVPDYLGEFYEVHGDVKQNSLFYKNHQFIKVSIDKEYRVPKLGVYHIQVELDGHIYEGTCHQISIHDQRSSILLQLNDCFVDTSMKRVKVKWIDYIYGKQNEAFGVNEYTQKDEHVI
ncbi:cytidyltransferase [Peribacillus butanolivorans]|uniref:FAD synthetase family protein n=1 Tax=Peribacillus butanolivorans TaxID=421767 RepID=UPI0006A6B936|nr:FAD synthetase family protein [Peribacillus butanolivorans]KON69459.1 cytidyltransferase [Peribacillus butanolivorans]